jgi:tetratricopeptide (TPR) repeat protein
MLLRIEASMLALVAALAGPAVAQQPPVMLPTNEPPAQPKLRTGTDVPVARPNPSAPVKPSKAQEPVSVNATDALIRQARTWRTRGRSDLAYQALRKAVSIEPRNAQILYLMALYTSQDGDRNAALPWLDRLRSVSGPRDGRVVALEKTLRTNPVPTDVNAGPQPPVVIAADTASNAPRSVLTPAPAAPDLAPPVAAGTAVADARGAQPVRKPQRADAPPRVINKDPGGEERAAGFTALNEGRLGDAESLFRRALNQRLGDSDAQGGLGIVRLRQQRFAEAERLLAQAMRGPAPSRWKEAFDSARFFDRFVKARDALSAGKLAEAEQLARPLTNEDFKDKTEAQLLLGEVYTRQQRYREAQAIYQEAYLRAPDRPEAIAGLADALSQLGRSEEALKLLDRLPRTASAKEARSRIERSRAADLQRRGDDYGAGAALAASLAANPANPWARYEFAKFLTARGQIQQANEVAAPLFAASGADVETLQAAALYADFIGRPDQSAAFLSRIPVSQRNAAVRELADRVDVKNTVARAQAMHRSGNTVTAVSLLREAAARPGVPFGARSQIAQSLMEMGDTYQAANLALAAAREAIPPETRPGEAGGFLAVLGSAGQDVAANNILQQMAQRIRSPEDQAAWRQSFASYGEKRADMLRTSGDLAAAFDTLSTAMTVAPRDPGLLAALARLYAAGNLGREAKQAYDLVLAQKPNDIGSLMDAARAASAAQDFDRAARLMERAAKLRPDDPEIFYDLGRLARARGHEREALSAFERAERLASRGADPRLAGLRSAQSSPLGPNPFARVATAPVQQTADVYNAPYAGQAPYGYPAAPSTPYSAPMPAGGAYPYMPSAPAGGMSYGNSGMMPANRPASAAVPMAEARSARQKRTKQPSIPTLMAFQQMEDLPPVAREQLSFGPAQSPYAQLAAASYEQSAPPPAAYEPTPQPNQAPAAQVPAYQPPAMQPPPSYPAPAYGAQPYQAPAYQPPPYQAPAYSAPAYQAPAYPAPAYQPPSYPQPAYQQPAQPPSYPVPTYQMPTAQAPVAQAPLPGATRGLPGIPDVPVDLAEEEANVDRPILGARLESVTDPRVPLAVRIRSEMQATRADSVPLLNAGVTSRLRSGEVGTSNLVEVSGNIEASFPVVGIGELGVAFRPVTLIAGRPTGDTVGRTGSYPLITAPGIINGVPIALPNQQTRSVGGVGGSLFFRSGWFNADVGATPYGFRYNDIVGGVRLTPRIGRLEIRVGAERRAVEDSVLSWSGDLDPVTGLRWGGVRRNTGTFGLSLNLDNVGGYIDGQLKRFQGRNVPSNNAVEVNGGFYWRPVNDIDQRLQVGMNVNYQSYDRNLRYFTLGHGGYFSPQQFVAVGLPVTYQGAGKDWRITLNLTPGIQAYSEDTAAIFPGFPQQQAQLVAFSLVDNTVPAFYTGQSRSGFGLAGRINGEFRIQRRTVIGGLLSVDTFGAFSEFRGNIFLRQQLNFGN